MLEDQPDQHDGMSDHACQHEDGTCFYGRRGCNLWRHHPLHGGDGSTDAKAALGQLSALCWRCLTRLQHGRYPCPVAAKSSYPSKSPLDREACVTTRPNLGVLTKAIVSLGSMVSVARNCNCNPQKLTSVSASGDCQTHHGFYCRRSEDETLRRPISSGPFTNCCDLIYSSHIRIASVPMYEYLLTNPHLGRWIISSNSAPAPFSTAQVA